MNNLENVFDAIKEGEDEVEPMEDATIRSLEVSNDLIAEAMGKLERFEEENLTSLGDVLGPFDSYMHLYAYVEYMQNVFESQSSESAALAAHFLACELMRAVRTCKENPNMYA